MATRFEVPTIPAGLRVEHLEGNTGFPEAAILSLLKAAFGGDDTPPWPANQRWLLWSADRLVGHVSVQRRWFVIDRLYFEGWFVGGVCVDPMDQGHGIGTLLMCRVNADLARQELDFGVLNCSRSLVGFYSRLGYTKIADRALYIRGARLLLEDDPAMAIGFRDGFDVTALACEAFPFGFNF